MRPKATTTLSNYRILLVEDQLPLAKPLALYLQRRGYRIVGCATSYEQAIVILQQQEVDVVLLSVELSGQQSGVAVAEYLRENLPDIPHIYLSAQVDQRTLQKAKATQPAGFLSKPLHYASVFTTIEMVVYKQRRQQVKKPANIILETGDRKLRIDPRQICFLAAEHVYVRVQLVDGSELLHRGTLQKLRSQLPAQDFLVVHRSYIVNRYHIQGWTDVSLTVAGQEIPLSRSRRKEVWRELKR